MRWRTTTPSGAPARASRTCPSTAAASPDPAPNRAPRPRRQQARGWLLACSTRARGTQGARRCSYPARMKVAVISDIHANRHAFEATLDAVAASDASELWCLGDLVGYGAEPDACVELAREHVAVCLAGNHDLAVTGEISMQEFSKGASVAAQWTKEVIDPENLAFLESLSPQGEEASVGLYHASPRDPIWE